ncbi:SUF system NifU family Fe-S cluster assembly protein [Candidatus Woesearchaeota archaeon]|nr:SUF system NifU family Fe-S cluster assembly protein [Candidatus Woesearchaeota archaeon]
MSNLYQEHILDHYSSPRNRRAMTEHDIYERDTNPLCGDEIAIYAKTKSGTITEASFLARGCAISQAAASMLTETVTGMTHKEIKLMGVKEMTDILQLEVGAARIKCAMLSIRTLQSGITRYEEKNGASAS